MDECSSRSAVSVDERVDGLELRMSDGRLCDGGKVVGTGESAEVRDQLLDVLMRGWDERSRARVVAASADPVLFLPKPASVLLKPGASQEPTMHFEEHIDRDGSPWFDGIDAVDHGIDVPEHLGGGDIGGVFLQPTDDLGMKEPSGSDFQSFDA